VCAQALILRDNGYTCHAAILCYDSTKQRVRVPVDDALIEETLRALADARQLAASGRIPPPLVDSPKSPRCSLGRVEAPADVLSPLRAAAGSQRGGSAHPQAR